MGSYNLRRAGLTESDSKNAWSVRKDRLKPSIQACAFDVVGFQEVDTEQQTWLKNEFGPLGYSFWFFSPYSQDGAGNRAQGIGFLSGSFTLLEKHYFWPGDNPDVMTINDTGANGTFKRGGCCVLLQHKASGKKIFFMDNHGCLNGECNTNAAPVYVAMEKKYNPSGFPSFFVGDMNAAESTTPGSVYMTYTSHWKDPYNMLDASHRKGSTGTYNGYSYPNGKSRIDFVFYRGEGVEPLLYTCDNTLYGGLYPSDHFPVWVDYKIQ
jgi:mRNA deadenylase 3'-5' endonuclease subunit Ccr4